MMYRADNVLQVCDRNLWADMAKSKVYVLAAITGEAPEDIRGKLTERSSQVLGGESVPSEVTE